VRTFLERYDAGERRQVWNELHALGRLGLVPEEVRRDVERVARRTMERAASDLDVIHSRLGALGFRFDLPEYAFVPAGAQHAEALAQLVAKVGEVPASLRALFAAIGDVSFRGWLPSWGSAQAWQALLLDPFEFLVDVKDGIDRVEDASASPAERDVRLSIAGDYLHKNDVSGGESTVVLLPSDEADARVVEDDGEWFRQSLANLRTFRAGAATDPLAAPPPRLEKPMWLVDYLRMYFDAGGFRRVPGTTAYPDAVLRGLAEGLLDL
jgi:hypothetical protein